VEVTLYTRPGCTLCEEARQDIEALAEDYEFQFRQVNIDEDPVLLEKYSSRIPVVAIDGEEVLVTRVSRYRFRKALEARQGRAVAGKESVDRER
jgi:glutaredoxin